jgi:ribonuclease H / adenosylcobalamin/alpha-ribazole phosphatase
VRDWPRTLWLIRHGQSAGNVARDAATDAGLDRIALEYRDVDVPLSDLGKQQAEVLGQWFAAQKQGHQPEVVIASPYRRALQTAEIFRKHGGAPDCDAVCIDERLREKEFGVLDGLTTKGISVHHPEQATFRSLLGKFYHRSPGGESWCDVILRLRSLMDTISLHHHGRDVMIVAHQVVVLCLRYILEGMDEATVLAIDKEADVANCAVTEYRFDDEAGKTGKLELVRYNETIALEEQAMPVTRSPDKMVGARG